MGDGDASEGDGCDSNCTLTACGNGIQSQGEECDDANTASCDGCSAACTIEPGGRCGDGILNTQCEQCDDGNTDPCDGCSATCRNEPVGYRCGDGSVVAACGEECDDGNARNGDACRNDCRTNVCGDGYLNRAAEECDDGNRNGFDGCTNDCTVCGDGNVSPSEECDDGNTINGDGCDGQCRFPHVVGTGTAESCTEAALDAALSGGGTVTFNCGREPVTITLTSTKSINADTTIDGGGLITLDGNHAVRLFSVETPAIPSAMQLGPAFNVRGLSLVNGSAREGGGIVSWNSPLSVSNSTFRDNAAWSGGCGYGPCYMGGAILLLRAGDTPPVTLSVADCTFEGNSAAYGGAIAVWDLVGEGSKPLLTATVSNTTLADNRAESGGGIHNMYASLEVVNSTFANNSGKSAGWGGRGAGIANSAGTLTLTNTIMGDSTSGGDCVSSDGITYGGHNLIEDAANSCGFADGVNGNIVGLDPMLDHAGLQDNGGPTHTIALLPGSPAIDAGDPEVCASPPANGVDQRGHMRPGEGSVNCSIGAYEHNASDLLLCNGDCNGDGEITVDEVIKGINIALGNISVCECMLCDTDDNGVISIAELIKAVHYALTGCPFWNVEGAGQGADIEGSAAAWIESMRRRCEEREGAAR